MWMNPLLKALTMKRLMEVGWKRTASKDGFASYNFRSGEVFGLEEWSVQVEKRARGSGGSAKTVSLAAAPVFFRAY